MPAKLTAELVLGDQTGAGVAASLPSVDAPQTAARVLSALLLGCASGANRGRLRVTVDEVTPVAAARTLTVTGADTATQYIEFETPTGNHRVTGVASGSAAGDRTFVVSATDNTVATNIRAAINTHPELNKWVVASGGTNSVVITALQTGTRGHAIIIRDGTGGGIGTAGALTGGKNASNRVTATITCVYANTDADDTVSIGEVTLTAKASPSGENQFAIGTDNATMTAGLLAKLQAHSKLVGIISAEAASNVITLTYTCDPRIATHIRLATSDADGLVITQPSAASVAYATSLATREYNLGAP
jgi:hypothetical protein